MGVDWLSQALEMIYGIKLSVHLSTFDLHGVGLKTKVIGFSSNYKVNLSIFYSSTLCENLFLFLINNNNNNHHNRFNIQHIFLVIIIITVTPI